MRGFGYEADKIDAAYHETLRMIERKEERARLEHQADEEALERVRMIISDTESCAFQALGPTSLLYDQIHQGLDESFRVWQASSEDVENAFQMRQRRLRQEEEDARAAYMRALGQLEEREGDRHGI